MTRLLLSLELLELVGAGLLVAVAVARLVAALRARRARDGYRRRF